MKGTNLKKSPVEGEVLAGSFVFVCHSAGVEGFFLGLGVRLEELDLG